MLLVKFLALTLDQNTICSQNFPAKTHVKISMPSVQELFAANIAVEQEIIVPAIMIALFIYDVQQHKLSRSRVATKR